MMVWLAGLATRRPRWVIAATVVVFLMALGVSGSLTGALHPGGLEDPGTEAALAREDLARAAGAQAAPGLLVMVDTDGPVAGAPARAQVERIAGVIARDPDVARVVSTYDADGGPALVARSGNATFLPVYFRPISDEAAVASAERIAEALADEPGVRLGGGAAVGAQIGGIVSADLARAELIAFPIIFLLSVWVFRGFVAALLPPLIGALVIFGGFLAVGLLNTITPISVYALNLVIGLSLGLAIDYSLLVVSRYREEIAAGEPGRAALERTLHTAGRSVVFSAVTVAAALAGLMVFPQPFLFSMGVGGVAVALIAATVAVLVLPAVLALLGRRVNAWAPRRWRAQNELAHERATSGFWVRLSHAVMRRPIPVATLTAVALIVVALPAFDITFTSVDARALPASVDARAVSDRLAREFPQAHADPISVALSAPTGGPEARGVRRELADYASALAATPGAVAVERPVPVGADRWRIDVYGDAPALSPAGQDLVAAVRAVPAPHPAALTGAAASFSDQKASLGAHLPWAILVIAAATIIALFLMTGSLLLPIKAVIMNLLTLGATLGLLVWIFEDGRLEGLFRYDSVDALDITSPILLGAVAFGLATDYAVFLLSRIKEVHDTGADTPEAVAVGLQRTGRIITAAALLFAVAIGAFVSSDILMVKELGFGTAVAVLIDATIIRALLVPSLMVLLGRGNWWAPGPLRRLHERIGFAETAPPPRAGGG